MSLTVNVGRWQIRIKPDKRTENVTVTVKRRKGRGH